MVRTRIVVIAAASLAIVAYARTLCPAVFAEIQFRAHARVTAVGTVRVRGGTAAAAVYCGVTRQSTPAARLTGFLPGAAVLAVGVLAVCICAVRGTLLVDGDAALTYPRARVLAVLVPTVVLVRILLARQIVCLCT